METWERKMEKENSAESFNFSCTICKQKGRIDTKAELFCKECNHHYCLSCVEVHEHVPFLFGHSIQNLQELQEKSSTALPAVLTERCVKHAYKLVDMYCLYHDTVCCALCQDADHRSCKNIFSVPEYVQHNELNPSLPIEDFQAEIESAMVRMLECQNVHQHKKQRLLAERDILLEKIALFRQEINAKLDSLENRTVSEIGKRVKSFTDELEEKIASLESDIARMKSAERSIGASTSNIYQVFVSEKIGLEIARKAKYIGDVKEDVGHMVIPDFKRDQRILAVLEEMNDMGIVRQINKLDTALIYNRTDIPKATSPPENYVNLNAEVAMTVEKTEGNKERSTQSSDTPIKEVEEQAKKVLQFQIKGKTIVCTKIDSDSKDIKSEGIISCSFLKNGNIILADCDNRKLKMLHRSTYQVTNQFDLPGSPWQLCAIDDDSIAVSLGTMRKIQFFSLPVHIQESGSFSTDHNCYGLAYANKHFYISDSSTYIYIYSEIGIKLKQLTHSLLRSPGLVVSLLDISLKRLAVNDDGSKIFVTHPTNGLIMLHNEGKDAKQYNGVQLQLAFGCNYLSENKGLLVCGMDSNNVLLFGPDGGIVQQVLRWDGGHDYKLVCCNAERTKMVVCRAGTYYIDIFDI